MKPRHPLAHGVLVLSLGLSAAFAEAGDDCDVPVQRWQSREAVMQMAARQGWQVQRLKIDDGCYELRGTDAEGRQFKATIDPETLKPVKMRIRDRDRDRERDRERVRAREGPRTDRTDGGPSPDDRSGGGTTAGPHPLFTPGTAPSGRIE